MADDDYNYYKEALKDQYNLIFMSFFVLLSVIAMSPMYAVVGAGLELLYVSWVPETEFFKRYIRNKYHNIKQREREAERRQRIQSLSHSQRRRYKKIDGIIESTKQNMEESGEGLGDRMYDKLDHLRERYLWMMELVNDYEGYLNSVQRGTLKSDIEELKDQIEEADGRVKSSLKERLDILEKRKKRLDKVRENHTIVQTQIETVEDILRLIYESSMTMQSPSDISEKVDELMVEVETTEKTVMELDKIGDDEAEMEEFEEKLQEAKQKKRAG